MKNCRIFLMAVVLGLVFSPLRAQLPVPIAQTPPMGWSSWYAFVDTINEQKIKETADALVRSGLRDCGYRILQLDDGWMAKQRDAQGRQYADTSRFPHGLKYLADYLHARGLFLGIYSSAGATTCAGYPGSYGHEEQDARNYAAWGIDYLKYDACGEKEKHSDKELFAKMSTALKATGRPILFNLCIFYSKDTHTWGAALGNTWRTGEDIVQFIEKNPKVSWQNWNKTLHTQVLGKEAYAGPGHWNDPDNLIVGYARNNEQSIEEQKAQFSFWALLAAPLFLGNDVRNMSPAIKTILSNKEVIAVNQDSLGKQGTRLKQEKDYELWAKELSGNAKAVVIFNTTDSSITVPVTRALTGATAKDAVVRDLWQHRRLKIGKKSMIVQLQPHAVVMYKVYVP